MDETKTKRTVPEMTHKWMPLLSSNSCTIVFICGTCKMIEFERLEGHANNFFCSSSATLDDTWFCVSGSCGIFYMLLCFLIQVIKNQEAVDLIKNIKDPQTAAKRLTTEALARKSKDDISCIVIRFRC